MSNKKIELPVDPERIIEIDPEGKYLVILPADTPTPDLKKTVNELTEWWLSDGEPFIVAAGDIVIIRIEDGEKEILYSPQETAETSSSAREETNRGEDDSTVHSASQDMQE